MEQIHGGNTFEYELLYGKKPLDFSANINPFKTPDKIKKAIADCIDSVYAYPDINCTKLREKISEYEKTKPEYITVGNGAADLIYAFCYAKKIKSTSRCWCSHNKNKII